MNIGERAFSLLYPEKDVKNLVFSVAYSGKFKSYNGNVRYRNNVYDFSLSREWKERSDEIKIGLLQNLLQKIFKTKIRTINQELYENFLKSVHIAVPKSHIDPELKQCFNRVNDRYFLGTVDMPNLVYGKRSFSKLGSYQYGNDTITISRVFFGLEGDDVKFLDYVMYHEMLHKVHKFGIVNGRSRHHTSRFRNAESQFERADAIEEGLKGFLRKKKFKSYFGM